MTVYYVSLSAFDEFRIIISPDGGLARVVTTGTLVEAVLGSGDLGIDGGTAGWDLLCSAEIMAHRSGLCGGIRVCRWPALTSLDMP